MVDTADRRRELTDQAARPLSQARRDATGGAPETEPAVHRGEHAERTCRQGLARPASPRRDLYTLDQGEKRVAVVRVAHHPRPTPGQKEREAFGEVQELGSRVTHRGPDPGHGGAMKRIVVVQTRREQNVGRGIQPGADGGAERLRLPERDDVRHPGRELTEALALRFGGRRIEADQPPEARVRLTSDRGQAERVEEPPPVLHPLGSQGRPPVNVARPPEPHVEVREEEVLDASRPAGVHACLG
jgi:hypothetical protein